MGDEQHTGTFPLGIVQQHAPDMSLRDRIQHRGNFVADEVARVRGKRAGYAEALQLAAGELMWVAQHPLIANPQVVEEFLRHVARLRQRFAHTQTGINRLLGMLLDQLHRAYSATRKRPTIEQYLASLQTLEPSEHAAQRGLAKPRGSLKRYALAGLDLQAESAVQGFCARVTERDVSSL